MASDGLEAACALAKRGMSSRAETRNGKSVTAAFFPRETDKSFDVIDKTSFQKKILAEDDSIAHGKPFSLPAP
jgi:hypothetical protein